MKKINNLSQNYPTCHLKNNESGMTLIEVLISMFVLAIGVLALLAVQLRSVASVREAEGQTIVSQITQNLIESMMINPTLSRTATSENATTAWTKKSYSSYLKSGTLASSCSVTSTPSPTPLTKASLATDQICQFSNDLRNAFPAEAKVTFTICQDTSGTPPTLTSNGTFNGNCNGTAGTTVVKVAWLADIEASEKSKDSAVVYTFQARVTD